MIWCMFVPQGQQVTANKSRFAKEMMDDTTAESCHQGPLARAHQTQVARGLSKAENWEVRFVSACVS